MKVNAVLHPVIFICACLLATTAQAGVINFPGFPSGSSFTRTITGGGDGDGVTALFANPATESGPSTNFALTSYLYLGSGGLPLSWDVTFSDTVALTEILVGDPVLTNLGFNVMGPGIAESGVLSGAGAGNHVLATPLTFLGNETYTFSAVNRNTTPPVTVAGGLGFETWVFGAVAVPEPSSLALLGLGIVAFRRRRAA